MNETILSLAKSLITIPSVKGDKRSLHEVLTIARAYLDGLTVEEFQSNGIPSLLVYAGKKRPEKFKLILNAHLDVVPGHKNQFEPYEKSGKLYGRGAYDMKAAGAVMIVVFAELAKKLTYPLGLQLTTDEEAGGFDGTAHQLEKGVRGDFAICGEYSSFVIKNKAKGMFWFKVTARGKAYHAAYPWHGDSALWKLQQVLNTVFEAFPRPDKPVWQSTINLAKIDTPNVTLNVIPDEASAYLDVRYIPEETEIIMEKMENMFPKDFVTEVLVQGPSAYTPDDNTYVKLLEKITTKITKQKTVVTGTHGASDVRFYNAVGVDGVEFGVKGEGQHAIEEWVDLKSLEQYYKILKEFILLLDKKGETI